MQRSPNGLLTTCIGSLVKPDDLQAMITERETATVLDPAVQPRKGHGLAAVYEFLSRNVAADHVTGEAWVAL